MSKTLAERAARSLGRRTGRRGFLRRSAMVGSALAVAPTDFVLRPKSAYAAICNCSGFSCDCSALCCDGYTEFCCTLYGLNKCPPGTLLGGWWKVDNSGICGGPKYYMDCNVGCGTCGCGSSGICSGSCSGTPCGCAQGTCANRKAGCTGFRYGQCNQAVPCMGPILCRVVTCSPPWEIDSTCTTTVRVDEATRFHNRPCLQKTDPMFPTGGVVSIVPQKGKIAISGWALDLNTTENIAVRVTLDNKLVGEVLATRTVAGQPQYAGYDDGHGFRVTVPAAPGEHDLKVIAVNAPEGSYGSNVRIERSTVDVPGTGGPVGDITRQLLAPNRLFLTGWALDLHNDDPVDVETSIDGELVNRVRATRRRRYVGNGIPDRGPNHGFQAKIPLPKGLHTFRISAVSRVTGRRRLLREATVDVPGSPAPVGLVDPIKVSPGRIRVSGWVVDPNVTTGIPIRVRVDGQLLASGAANLRRDIVAAGWPSHGPNHGFDFTIPVSSGSHQVKVIGLNRPLGGAGTNGVLTNRAVVVP